jgi:ABC-type Na+ efflux pump permease subunit
MKNVIVSIVLVILVVLGAGYFGLPLLIEKETSALKAEVQDLRQRLQAMEEMNKVAPLTLDADAQKIITTVNALSRQMRSLEQSGKQEIAATTEAIKAQKTSTEENLKKQTDTVGKTLEEMRLRVQEIGFHSTIANIREHVLKARMEIVARNIGNAKTELDVIDELIASAMAAASDENKKVLGELQTSLKKAKSEIESDLQSATNRLNILWNEMGRLLRKA